MGLLVLIHYLFLVVGAGCGLWAVREVRRLRVEVRSLRAPNRLAAELDIVRSGVLSETYAEETDASADAPPEILRRKTAAPELSGSEAPASETPVFETPASEPAEPVFETPPREETRPPARPLEDVIGAQWTVWVGGAALLFGVVSLLRFSIEAGLLGPAARVGLAAVLGVAMLVLGERLRRGDADRLSARLLSARFGERAYIPGLVSATGVFALYGATYAAHALYGFIGPLTGIVGLGAVAVGAYALALRQGRMLGAIGLVSSLATPLLVQTQTPSLPGLIVYLALVTLAGLAVWRRKGWDWLTVGLSLGWLGWIAATAGVDSAFDRALWFGMWTLALLGTVWASERGRRTEAIETLADIRRSLQLSPLFGILWAAAAASILYITDPAEGVLPASVRIGFAVVLLSTLAVRFPRQAALALVAAVLAAAGASTLAVPPAPGLLALVFALTPTLALVRTSLRASGTASSLWAVLAVAASAVVLRNIEFAIGTDTAWGLYLVAGGAFALVVAWRKRTDAGWALRVFTLGASAHVAFALILAFPPVWEVVALTALIAFCGVLALRDRVPGARWSLILLGAAAGATALWSLTGVGGDEPLALAPTPVFNALWALLALPAGAMAALGWRLSRRAWSLSGESVAAVALALTTLFVIFQIRHLSNGGVVVGADPGFGELGLQVATGLALSLAALRLSRPAASGPGETGPLRGLAVLIGGVSLAVFALGVLIATNPLLMPSERVEGSLAINSATLSFGVNALLLGLAATFAEGRRPVPYVRVQGGLALLGLMAFLTAQVRMVFVGGRMAVGHVGFGNAELYTLSAVWLVAGVALLVAGMRLGRRDLRAASAVVIVATTLKTFFVDMAGLEGALRALSLLGLGGVLIVIGWVYQKLLARDADHATAIRQAR